MIRYSVIVPFRGSPELLRRALASVPSREDVEVLTVEDADGRGAGWARNQALSRAVGEWLLFLDADDFFEADAFALLDRHFADEADLVCFSVRALMSDSLEPSSRQDEKLRCLAKYGQDPAKIDFYCRYCYPEPWGKMVRRSLVARAGIRFDETSCANDYSFSVLCGIHAGRVVFDPASLYVVTERPGSVSRDYFDTPQKVRDRLSVYWRVQQAFDAAGIGLEPFYGLWMMCSRKGGETLSLAREFCAAQGISRCRLWRGCALRVIKKRLSCLK